MNFLVPLALCVATAMAGTEEMTVIREECGFVSNSVSEEAICAYEENSCAVLVELAMYPGEEDDEGSCDNFCHSQGKTCVAAANDVGNECPEEDALDEENCSNTGSGDYVCQCSMDAIEDDCADKFENVKLFCGECTVLVDGIDDYETCAEYCHSQDRVCESAWEESANTCMHADYEVDCDTDFTNFAGGRSTTDALCKCHEDGYVVEEPTEAPVECDTDKCPANWLNDGECDVPCNNAACGFDEGDCGEDDDVECEGEYSEWSECTGECDDWSMTRTFEVDVEPVGDVDACPEDETEECNTEPIYSCMDNCGLTHRCIPPLPEMPECQPWDYYCMYYQQQQQQQYYWEYQQQYQQGRYNPYQFYPQQQIYNPYQQGGFFGNWYGAQAQQGEEPAAPVQRPVTAQSGFFGGLYGGLGLQQSAWTLNPGLQGIQGVGQLGAATTNLRFRSGGEGEDAKSGATEKQAFFGAPQQQLFYPQQQFQFQQPQQPAPQQQAPVQQQFGFYGQQYAPQQYAPQYGQQYGELSWRQQECSCDMDCTRYGDCCYDFQYYCVPPPVPQYPWGGYPYQQPQQPVVWG